MDLKRIDADLSHLHVTCQSSSSILKDELPGDMQTGCRDQPLYCCGLLQTLSLTLECMHTPMKPSAGPVQIRL